MLVNEPVTIPEPIQLVHSGLDYFSRLEHLIRNSEFEIHIQIYILDDDATGKIIMEALKKAAARKVKIYLLLDGFGSFSIATETIQELRKSGIHCRFFAPLFSANTFYIGRRMHHKVAIIDAKTVLIGGINIANKYRGTNTKSPWLDYAVAINNEQIAEPLRKLCNAIYFKKKMLSRNKISTLFKPQEHISILRNDWLNRRNEISNAYIKSISEAKSEIYVVGGYFLPGRKLTMALKKAAKNKVKIKLILTGISDVPMARRAGCHLYSKLLNHNIELYEWNQSVLHGKAAIIDQRWTTIGSFNLNNLSSYASIEMNVEINSESFAKKFQLDLDEIISQCQRMTPESLKIRNHFMTKAFNWLSFWMVRVLVIIFTYLPYKRFLKS